MEIVLGEERAEDGVADVATEAGGGVVISAEADVVGFELVVVGEFAGAFDGEEIVRVAGVAGHPETIEIADAVVGASLLDGCGFVLNQERAFQFGLEPDGCAGGDIDVEAASGGCD